MDIKYSLHKLLLQVLIIKHNIKTSVFNTNCPYGQFEKNNTCEYNNCYISTKTNCDECISNFTGVYQETREVFENIQEAYSLSKYIQPARELIHSHKWTSPALSLYFAHSLYSEFREIIDNWQIDYIIPVPSFISRERPWSPSLLLATRLSQISGIKLLPNTIIKNKATHLYSESKQTRRENLEGAFSLNSLPPAKNILLIDDLIASGLSLENTAQLILSQNPDINIYALALCSSKQ